MQDKCPKGQRQRLDMPGKCPKEICDCDLPAVPTVAEIDRVNLLDKINNPDFVMDIGTDRLLEDILEDGKYTKKRKREGTC